MAAAFRPKRLDIAGNISANLLRDHVKRKTFAEYEPERYATCPKPSLFPCYSRSRKADSNDAQTSSPLHNPQHNPPPASPRPGPAPARQHARLHSAHTDQEPMCCQWAVEGCFPGVQVDKGEWMGGALCLVLAGADESLYRSNSDCRLTRVNCLV